MGSGASTRRATIGGVTLARHEDGKCDDIQYDRSQPLRGVAELEKSARRTNSPPRLEGVEAPPTEAHLLGDPILSGDTLGREGDAKPSKYIPTALLLQLEGATRADAIVQSALDAVDGRGSESAEVLTRRKELHTLQEEVHQKKTVGMSYNDIFTELASQAKEEGAAKKGAGKMRRRATEEGLTRNGLFPVVRKLSTVKSIRGLIGTRKSLGSNVASEVGVATQPSVSEAKGEEQNDREPDPKRRSAERGEDISPDFREDGTKSSGPRGGEGMKGAGHASNSKTRRVSFEQTVPLAGNSEGLDPPPDDRRAPDVLSANKPLRRAQIFDKGVDASMMQDLLVGDIKSAEGIAGGGPGAAAPMGEQATDIVIGALQKFFFFDNDPEEDVREGRGGESGGMAMLMRAMEREEYDAGILLMEQGEEGHHMFVVEEGNLEVIIGDEAIRVIGVGDRVGELAILCNAPRSASVRTLSPCVLWSIHREVFKAVQALTSSANLIPRSTHLYHVPWLRLLGTTDLSKLAACFTMAQYKDGDIILGEGEETDRCFLIESGEVVCSVQCSQGDEGPGDLITSSRIEICERVERLMMVTRPGSRPQTRSPVLRPQGGTSPRPITARHSQREKSSGRNMSEERRSFDTTTSRAQVMLNLDGVKGLGASLSECRPHWDEVKGEVRFGNGCFLGVPVLLASAELELDGLPAWELATSSQPRNDSEEVGEASKQPAFAAFSPVKIVAQGDIRLGHFNVARFAKTVGPFAKVLGSAGKGGGKSALRSVRGRKSSARNSLLASPGGALALKCEKLAVKSFERMAFLGQGSFGHVTMVRKREGVMEGALFAVKSLSKHAVVEGGQVQHIKDEKTVLEMFSHPFILRLYTTFQDENRVYFLTELLRGGELWSVIYEAASGYERGLPSDHTMFFSAVVVDALGYMHKKGIAYRDLKPENLIVDDVGYLRIIDMGFAKRIPFFVTVGGKTQMHPKSHTMCGTPEYLAPEFIFNKGHDQSADIWALGVLMFELVEARTPFTQPGSEQDIAQLFTNIACVKKRGVVFPDNFDDRAGGSHCRHIISGMLAFEPGERLGNLANGMDDVKKHAMYKNLNWGELASKTVPAPWVPEGPASHSEPHGIASSNDVYGGDQGLFEDF